MALSAELTLPAGGDAEAPRRGGWLATPPGRRAAAVGRVLLLVLAAWLLVRSLRGVAWTDVVAALPTGPAFYLIFLAWYLWLPATDLLVYRMHWRFPRWRSLLAFVVKRIYNREVLQFSGEVWFHRWARRRVDRPSAELARTIRDQNILQSVASTGVAAVLLTAFLLTGGSALVPWHPSPLVVGLAALALGVGGWLAFRTRRRWFSMEAPTAWRMLAVHAGRFAGEQVLQVAMWQAAAPVVGIRAWLVYAAVSLVIARIPLVTNRDLLFASAGVGLAARAGLPVDAVAAAMLMTTGLAKLLTVGAFAAHTIGRRRLRA